MSMDKVFTSKTHVPCNARAVQYKVNADRNVRYTRKGGWSPGSG